jgi:hypothetical protein
LSPLQDRSIANHSLIRHNTGMTDEHFRALRQLILEQSLKIEELALAVRTMQRRIEELAGADHGYPEVEVSSAILSTDQLDELLKTRQSRGQDTDN